MAEDITVEADLHCHLLPDWDDGPATSELSLQMAAQAVAAGIHRILVTPHVGRVVRAAPERPAQSIPGATLRLEQTLRAAGLDLSLVPGAELTFADPQLAQRVAAEPWLTVGGQGRYILIESTFGRWPQYADQMLYELSLVGITSIIAHPERLPDAQKDINVLRPAVERGALLQITARSLMDGAERRSAQCSRALCQAGLVALVASDAHSGASVWPGEVAGVVQKIVGHEAAHRILKGNPQAVLDGEPVIVSPVSTNGTARSKFWPFKQRARRL